MNVSRSLFSIYINQINQNIAGHAEFDWFLNLAEGDRQKKTTLCPNAVANTDSFITIL